MDQKDNNSEQESQRVCYNIMAAVALRVDGIEKADSLADKGTKLKQKDIPITHDIARARIKKQDPPQKSQGDLQRQVETKVLGRKEMDEKSTISILKAKI